MHYFDIHSHLYFPEYDTDRDQVIAHLKEQGIWTCSIGTDLKTSKQAALLAEKHEHLYASIGVHPAHDDLTVFSKDFEELVTHQKVVAIGECGFDFFRTPIEEKEKVLYSQEKIFEAQIHLAVQNNKALMLHSRPTKGTQDAYEETLRVLEPLSKMHGEKLFGNAHFFVGDMDILRRFLNIGFTVSFTGVVTFTTDYNEIIRYTPLESMHAETDAPFVAPVSHRGKRNSPEYITEIVRALALIKEEDVLHTEEVLLQNAKRLFRI